MSRLEQNSHCAIYLESPPRLYTIELYPIFGAIRVLFFAGDTMLSTTFSLLGVSIETDDEEDESGLTSDMNDDATTQVLKIQ